MVFFIAIIASLKATACTCMNQLTFNDIRIEYTDSLLRAANMILKELYRFSLYSNLLLWMVGPSINSADNSAFLGVSFGVINGTQILQAEY